MTVLRGLLLTTFAFSLSCFAKVEVSYLGCYVEPPRHRLFPKVYLDYRKHIDLSKYPDMSHVVQACARRALVLKFTHFAITKYGICVWGPNGKNVGRIAYESPWCFRGLGGFWLVSVYKIAKVDGRWSAWSAWGGCSLTCGNGLQTRRRTCTNRPPSAGGAACSGISSQSQSCNTRQCPACEEGVPTIDKCGQRCACAGGRLVNCVRIRKEFTSMTIAERSLYISVIKTASTDPRLKPEYDNLLNEHRRLFLSGIHNATYFLPWHRYFNLLYENLLRRVDCRFTVSYWNWTVMPSSAFNTTAARSIWSSDDSGLGGDGEGNYSCVQTGPFRQDIWSIVPLPQGSPTELGPRCLARMFFGIPPDAVAVQMVLDVRPSNFSDFELMLRVNLHDLVHCLIDGTMCTLDSAAAPEFFLHHGFVDKIWNDWQKKSESHKNVFFSNILQRMPGTQVRPSEVLDLSAQPGGIRIEYQPILSVANTVAPFSGAENGARPRGSHRERYTPLNDRIFKFFHVSKAEMKRAKKMEKRLEPKPRTIKI